MFITAHAGRPLQTEDADVLQPDTCEWESATAHNKLWRGATEREISTTVQCGLSGQAQIGGTLARSKVAAEREAARGLVGKVRLWPRDAQDPERALTLAGSWLQAKPQGGRFGDADRSEVKLVYSGALAPHWTVHANAGHARVTGEGLRARATTWGLAIEHEGLPTRPTLAPMMEVLGNDRESRPAWNLGLRLTVMKDRAWLDVSYGRSAALPDKPRLITAGLKLAF
jgi:hypothetical protein